MIDCLALPDTREMAHLGALLMVSALCLEALAQAGPGGASTAFHAGIAAVGVMFLTVFCLDVIEYWLKRAAGYADEVGKDG